MSREPNLSVGELEYDVLEVLWSAPGPMSVRDMTDTLERSKNLAYTTVLTVLGRLYEKRLVVRQRDGRGFQYWPALTRDAFLAKRALSALSGGGAPTTGVWMALLDSADASDPGVLDRLSRLIAEKKRGRQ